MTRGGEPQVTAEDSARCLVNLVHADKSKARCVLGLDHLEQETDHLDEHGHHAPCLRVNQAIAALEALHAEDEDSIPLLVRRPRDRAIGALEDAISLIREGDLRQARELLAEAQHEMDTAEWRAAKEATR